MPYVESGHVFTTETYWRIRAIQACCGGTIPAETDANSFAASKDACDSPAAQYVVTGPNLDFYNIFECEQF